MIEKNHQAEETGPRKFLCKMIGALLSDPPPPEDIRKQLLEARTKLSRAGDDLQKKIEQRDLSELEQTKVEDLRPLNAAITRYREACDEYVSLKAKIRQLRMNDCPTQKLKKLMRDFVLGILQERVLTE